jgi:hypothetical protein
MARIESQAKAGFYPTPDSVCELLKTKITYEDGARLLDPCCGKGVSASSRHGNSRAVCLRRFGHLRHLKIIVINSQFPEGLPFLRGWPLFISTGGE